MPKNKWIKGYFKFNIMEELTYDDELEVRFIVSVEKKLQDPENIFYLTKQFDVPGHQPEMKQIKK